MTAAPDISLPRFEGPLDLLLDLVRKHQLAITDIPISEITRQYLDYLHQAERLDIDLGAEFSYIAALLIHIKSRCLLARDPELAISEEDPRQELTRLLLDHDQVRQGAEFLKQKLELTQATWSKTPSAELAAERSEPEVQGSLNLLEVLRLAKLSLDTARTYEIIFPAESVTVEEMERWLGGRIAGESVTASLSSFFAELGTTDRRAALFLAALEMAKAGTIHLEQAECFEPIFVTKGTTVP